MEIPLKCFDGAHKHRFELETCLLMSSYFLSNLLICFTHLARAYLSLLAWRGSDWLQMISPLPGRRVVKCFWPNLKPRCRFRLINVGHLTCQSVIQHINHTSSPNTPLMWTDGEGIQTFTTANIIFDIADALLKAGQSFKFGFELVSREFILLLCIQKYHLVPKTSVLPTCKISYTSTFSSSGDEAKACKATNTGAV